MKNLRNRVLALEQQYDAKSLDAAEMSDGELAEIAGFVRGYDPTDDELLAVARRSMAPAMRRNAQ